ncbi:MAG: hypothetical protein ACTINM_08710 [Acetobacter cibinongensis]
MSGPSVPPPMAYGPPPPPPPPVYAVPAVPVVPVAPATGYYAPGSYYYGGY